VYERRDPDRVVAVSVDKTPVSIAASERVQFSIASSQSGYVYVLELSLEENAPPSLLLLFPNAVDRNNRVSANARLALPRESWPLIAGPPPGVNRFVVIVSDSPRDFSALRPRKVGPEGIAEFPRDVVAKLYEAHQATTPLLAGRARCPADSTSCSDAYGAAEFDIEVR
jgi:hypothetical protein